MFEQQIDIETPKELLDYFLSWNNKTSGFIFRGHANEEWELTPSALRKNEMERIRKIFSSNEINNPHTDMEFLQLQVEYIMLRDFYIMSDRHGLRVPNTSFFRDNLASEFDPKLFEVLQGFHHWVPRELDDIAALAQHYGIPTRLLDWTYDPMVALHFALKAAIGSAGRLCVWCLNKNFITSPIFNYTAPNIRFITPPYFDNPNLNAQKGLFTHIPIRSKMPNGDNFGNFVDRRPLDVILKSHYEMLDLEQGTPVFIKITFPCELARLTYIALEDHGYGTSKIFPGYGGIAQQILETYPLRSS